MYTAGSGQVKPCGLLTFTHHLEDSEGAPLIVFQLVHSLRPKSEERGLGEVGQTTASTGLRTDSPLPGFF